MGEGVKIVLLGLAFVVGLILVVGVGLNWLEGNSCEARWRDSGLQSRYGFWSDCQVRVKGKWIPATNYREM